MASEEQVAIFSFIQRSTQYLKEVYPTCNEEVLDDMIELFKNVLQYYVLVIDDISGTLFQSLRDLLATLISDKEGRVRSMRRGRPEISVSLEQLRYLVEQGFSARECLVVLREQS